MSTTPPHDAAGPTDPTEPEPVGEPDAEVPRRVPAVEPIAVPTAAQVLAALRHSDATLEPGLTGGELDRLEAEFDFAFAPDHRLALSVALPVGGMWPNWREDGARRLRARLAMPVEGVLFDVENHGVWFADWGTRPAQTRHAIRSARYHLERAPRLVPLYGHRYLPGVADAWGQPVLSVTRTDVVVHGANLLDWLAHEFAATPARPGVVTAPFWRDLVG